MIPLLFFVSFLSSVIGAICGIGGGVIIKPVLDSLNIMGASTISFLSGCTVLSMSCYSVGKTLVAKESLVDFKTGTPLAIGAAMGGVVGKNLFSLLRAMTAQSERIAGYQSVCLAMITLATLLYIAFQNRIKTHRVKNSLACSGVGLMLGIFSGFLGIGGGPINLVVLYFCFSMPTKTAAQNSLYIILISQSTSLLTTIATHSIPEYNVAWLAVMIAGGIGGGMVGHKINTHIEDKQVQVLFICLMMIIIGVSWWNAVRFLW